MAQRLRVLAALSRGPKFDSEHWNGASQPFLAPVPGDPMGTGGTHTYMYANIQTQHIQYVFKIKHTMPTLRRQKQASP